MVLKTLIVIICVKLLVQCAPVEEARMPQNNMPSLNLTLEGRVLNVERRLNFNDQRLNQVDDQMLYIVGIMFHHLNWSNLFQNEQQNNQVHNTAISTGQEPSNQTRNTQHHAMNPTTQHQQRNLNTPTNTGTTNNRPGQVGGQGNIQGNNGLNTPAVNQDNHLRNTDTSGTPHTSMSPRQHHNSPFGGLLSFEQNSMERTLRRIFFNQHLGGTSIGAESFEELGNGRSFFPSIPNSNTGHSNSFNNGGTGSHNVQNNNTSNTPNNNHQNGQGWNQNPQNPGNRDGSENSGSNKHNIEGGEEHSTPIENTRQAELPTSNTPSITTSLGNETVNRENQPNEQINNVNNNLNTETHDNSDNHSENKEHNRNKHTNTNNEANDSSHPENKHPNDNNAVVNQETENNPSNTIESETENDPPPKNQVPVLNPEADANNHVLNDGDRINLVNQKESYHPETGEPVLKDKNAKEIPNQDDNVLDQDENQREVVNHEQEDTSGNQNIELEGEEGGMQNEERENEEQNLEREETGGEHETQQSTFHGELQHGESQGESPFEHTPVLLIPVEVEEYKK